MQDQIGLLEPVPGKFLLQANISTVNSEIKSKFNANYYLNVRIKKTGGKINFLLYFKVGNVGICLAAQIVSSDVRLTLVNARQLKDAKYEYQKIFKHVSKLCEFYVLK